jgi:hypothetical protein
MCLYARHLSEKRKKNSRKTKKIPDKKKRIPEKEKRKRVRADRLVTGAALG